MLQSLIATTFSVLLFFLAEHLHPFSLFFLAYRPFPSSQMIHLGLIALDAFFFIFKKNRLFFGLKKSPKGPSLDWIHKLQTQSYSHSAD
jgi:hypothetical protein